MVGIEVPLTVKTYGPTPPNASSAWLNGTLTSAAKETAAGRDTGAGLLTVIEYVRGPALELALSVTTTVNETGLPAVAAEGDPVKVNVLEPSFETYSPFPIESFVPLVATGAPFTVKLKFGPRPPDAMIEPE